MNQLRQIATESRGVALRGGLGPVEVKRTNLQRLENPIDHIHRIAWEKFTKAINKEGDTILVSVAFMVALKKQLKAERGEIPNPIFIKGYRIKEVVW